MGHSKSIGLVSFQTFSFLHRRALVDRTPALGSLLMSSHGSRWPAWAHVGQDFGIHVEDTDNLWI